MRDVPVTPAQRVAQLAADDTDWIDGLARAIADRVHREVAGFNAHPELFEASASSSGDNIHTFLQNLLDDAPASRIAPGTKARAYVRLMVERKLGADDLAAAYRIGVSSFWTRWTERLQHEVSGDDYAGALAESTQYILRWSDALTSRIVALHAEERALWNRDPEAVRHDAIRAILDGRPVDEQQSEQRMRYPLRRAHRCVVVWAGDSSVDLSPELLGTVLPDGLPRASAPTVALPLGPLTAVWWATDEDAADALPTTVGPNVRAAIGSAQPGLEGFRRTYEEAMQARRVAMLQATEPGAVTTYDAVALRSLASHDLEQATRFVESVLGDLASEDPTTRELAATLRAFLGHSSNLRATASALGVHHNTVANRLRRAEGLLVEPVLGRTAEIIVALELLPVVRPAGG